MKTKTQKIQAGPKYRNYAAIPETYRELCSEWLPRPIHDDATAQEAYAMIDAICGFDLNPEQTDYLETVAHFVEEHDGPLDLPKVSGLEMLRYLCAENDLTGADISRILGSSRLLGPMILRGERNITAEHARAFGERFHMNPGAFL
jgi:antitoxin component HigA of HigAB toxin-antitoxin module